VSNPLFLAYESCKDRFERQITFDEFKLMFADWECIPVDVKGECAGALMCKDAEIHACIIKKHHKHWASKKLWSTVFKERLSKYGYLTTGVTANNEIGKRFVERCGFREYDRFANVVIYRLVG
jgi:hypothetical protein